MDLYINQTLLSSENLSKKINQDLNIYKIKTNNKKFILEKTIISTKIMKRSFLIETVEAVNQKKKTFKEVCCEL